MALRDLFAGIKKSLQSLGTQMNDLRAQIEKLKRQRDDLIAAPVAKSDFLAAALGFIDSKTAQYPAALQRRITDSGLMFDPDHLARLPDKAEHMDQALGLTAAMNHNNIEPSWRRVENALLFLLGDQVKDALRLAVDKMDWPAGAVSFAERKKRLDALDREIGELEADLSDIMESAGKLRDAL